MREAFLRRPVLVWPDLVKQFRHAVLKNCRSGSSKQNPNSTTNFQRCGSDDKPPRPQTTSFPRRGLSRPQSHSHVNRADRRSEAAHTGLLNVPLSASDRHIKDNAGIRSNMDMVLTKAEGVSRPACVPARPSPITPHIANDAGSYASNT